MNLGERIRAARRHAGLTQVQLAKAVGVTQQSIAKIETGKADGTASLLDICIECGVSPRWLARNEGDMVLGRIALPDPPPVDREHVSIALTAIRRFAKQFPPSGKLVDDPAFAPALAGALNELSSVHGTDEEKLKRATERIADAFGNSGEADGQASDGGVGKRSSSKAGSKARKDPR